MNTTNMHGHTVLCERKRNKPYGIDWDCDSSFKKPKLLKVKESESDRTQYAREEGQNSDIYTVFSLPREIYSLILHQLSKSDLTR